MEREKCIETQKHLEELQKVKNNQENNQNLNQGKNSIKTIDKHDVYLATAIHAYLIELVAVQQTEKKLRLLQLQNPERKEFLHQIAEAATVISQKHRLLKSGKDSTARKLSDVSKPVVTPLQELTNVTKDLKLVKQEVEEIKEEIKKMKN
ncbi:uncharacterized protein [Neodiprion pinetum]|uniref:uncharacterized protein n=1 Tax=Neodiprion pinetum TaxID=441929 RepID=UPI003718AE81